MSKNKFPKQNFKNKWLQTLENKKYELCLSDQLGLEIPVKKNKHFILDHAGEVASIAVSPDGQFLYAGNKDGRVSQWRIDTGSFVMVFEGEKPVLSADGLYLYTVCQDKTICQWDTKSGRCQKRFEGHINEVTAMVASDDNKHIFSGTEKSLRQWDIQSGKCRKKTEELAIPVNLLAVNPDATFFYTIRDGSIICQYDAETAKSINSFETHSGKIKSMALAPDDNSLFTDTEDDDKSVYHWDLKSGKLLNCFKGQTNTVNVGTVSHDGNYLFSLYYGSIRQWHIKSGRCIREFEDLPAFITSLAVDSLGNFLFTGHYNKSIHHLDLKSGRSSKNFGEHINDMRCAEVSSDGKSCFVANWDRTVCQRDLKTGRCTNVFQTGHTYGINSIAISSKGEYLYTSSSDTTVRQFSVTSGELLMVFRGHTNGVESIILSPDDEFIYSGGLDNTVRKWHISSGKQMATYDHPDMVLSLEISRDGKSLWTGCHYCDGAIRQWETETGKCVNKIEGNGNSVYCMTLSIDDNFLFYSSGSTIHQLEINPGRCIGSFKNTESVYSLTASPCGKYVYSGSPLAARQWEIKSHCCTETFTSRRHDSSYIALAQEGTLLFTGYRSNSGFYEHHSTKVKIWDTKNGELLATCYNLKKGFLWKAPPCKQTGMKYFWTDRPELLNIHRSYQDGSRPEMLQLNDPEREIYILKHNQEGMVMGRLYDSEEVKEEQTRFSNLKNNLNTKARINNHHAMIEYKPEDL